MRAPYIELKDSKYSLYAETSLIGEDICVCVYGGDTPHIGATAISVPRHSLSDESVFSSSTSVHCITGHKEDELAKLAAGRLAATFGITVVVCVGIHIDGASHTEIGRLVRNFNVLLERLIEKLRSGF